jgi:hypothetical protein
MHNTLSGAVMHTASAASDARDARQVQPTSKCSHHQTLLAHYSNAFLPAAVGRRFGASLTALQLHPVSDSHSLVDTNVQQHPLLTNNRCICCCSCCCCFDILMKAAILQKSYHRT